MIEPLRYARQLFDALDDVTSDETTQHGIYAGTRSSEGVYAVTNTQSAQSTYRATGEADGDKLDGDAERFDCPNPETCSTCQPIATAD